MCEALRTSGEMAAFVALSITTLGHSIIDFQVMPCRFIEINKISAVYICLEL